MKKRILKKLFVFVLSVMIFSLVLPLGILSAEVEPNLSVGSCYDPDTGLFTINAYGKNSTAEWRLFRYSSSDYIDLGTLGPGDSTSVQTPLEGTWVKKYKSDEDWIQKGGTHVTSVEGHTNKGYICPKEEPVPDPGGLVVFKYSGDQPLAGAVFDVVNEDGFAAKITSGANGIASISGLEPGTYYVREVVAPEGYEIDPSQYTVSVAEGGTGRVDIENAPLPAPTPTPTPPEETTEVTGISEEGEVGVLGVSEELPYTGYNWLYYIIGFSVIVLAGGLAILLKTLKKDRA